MSAMLQLKAFVAAAAVFESAPRTGVGVAPPMAGRERGSVHPSHTDLNGTGFRLY
jgi:hypothetical protein